MKAKRQAQRNSTIKALRSISNRMVGLNNTCQYSAQVETEDISSSQSWQGWTRWNKIPFQVNCWSPRCNQRLIFNNFYQNYSSLWTGFACGLAKLRLTHLSHFILYRAPLCKTFCYFLLLCTTAIILFFNYMNIFIGCECRKHSHPMLLLTFIIILPSCFFVR